MVDDLQQKVSEEQGQLSGLEFASRRRVIRGLAAAVPVIMTVTSGQALANASSLQCIGKPEGVPAPEWIDADQTDIWVRQLQQDPDSGDAQRKRLLYADQYGSPATSAQNGNPYTASCYNSFLTSG